MKKRDDYTPSYKQIANVLGCTEQNVKNTMNGQYGSKKKIERLKAEYAERLKEVEEELKEKYSTSK